MRHAPTRPRRALPTALLVVAAAAAAAWWLLRVVPAGWVDGPWANGVLPVLTTLARPWLAAFPASLTAATLAGAIAIAVLIVVGPRRALARRLALLLAAVTVAGASFEVAWGVAYRRTPLEARLGLPEAGPTAADVDRAAEQVLAIATQSAPSDPASVDVGAPWPEASWTSAAACVAAADAIVSERQAPLALAATVRRLPAGLLLSGGFAGFVGPWWREPHVDGALPPVAARATALHELVHAAGWAREAETDALAVLAGLRCDASEVRFAAAVHALGLLRSERVRVGRGALETPFPPVPDTVARAETALRAAAAAHARPAVTRAAGATYDLYLRAQGVEAGLADYGRAGVLVVAALARCDAMADARLCPAP